VDHRVPLLKRHLVKRAVPGDAGIVDEHVDRTQIGLDLLDAGGAGIERTDVPFEERNAGLGLEFFGGGIVAGIAGRDFIAGRLQRLADCSANSPRSSRYQRNTCHVESFPWRFLNYTFYVASNKSGRLTNIKNKMPGT